MLGPGTWTEEGQNMRAEVTEGFLGTIIYY